MSPLHIPLCAGLLLLCSAVSNPVSAQVFNADVDAVATKPERFAAVENNAKTWKRQARSHHSKAVYLADLGRTAEAIEEDRQAISTDPNNVGYQILMGSLLIDSGKLDCALATYERVCARFPGQAPYLSDLMNELRMGVNMIRLEKAISRAETSPGSAASLPPAEHPCAELAPPPVQIEVINPDAKPSSSEIAAAYPPPDWKPPKPSKAKAAGKLLLNILLGIGEF